MLNIPQYTRQHVPQQRLYSPNLVLGSSMAIWPIGLQFKAVANDIEEARSSLGDVFPY